MRRVLRALLWALAIAFLVGFLIGSLLRRELERPVRYIGGHRDATTIYDAPVLQDGLPSRSDPGWHAPRNLIRLL